MKAETITQIESLDLSTLKNIPKSKSSEDPVFISFNKIWIWVLEIFYNTPLTKYYWPEFRDKVIKKDGGEDLKRRMILYNVKNMGLTNQNELFEIMEIHSKVVTETYGNKYPEFKKLISVLSMYLKQKEEDVLYNDIKNNAVEEDDVEKIK